MSGRRLIIGDIHARYERLRGALEKASFNPEKDILYSPETSGGLLISLAEKDAELFIKRMNDKAWIIGEVKGKRDKLIYVD